jgi:hypothetical protein
MHFKCQWPGETLARSAHSFRRLKRPNLPSPLSTASSNQEKEVPDECNQLAKTTNGKAVEELDVLVVSAGFAGLDQLKRSASSLACAPACQTAR